ncbi:MULTISPECIES: glutathione S-transferase family protein [unclassified Rhizobium]|uniref:glutathione S-transferase family protein n=1 Tax=unclassified Rhizobium TaxID=2613769 RepID=UPI0021F7620A|nr:MULTISPECIES: glutathione S-transferase family protein [unclassified Rhizobium]MCV9943842.1 glutathione S-transferase family protein [Rhizobium sp. BT-175]MCW0017406.1 glutathione S-transferase family protein [Rhizobium sp. BT-226]
MADDRDAILFESMVICEYLEETQGGGKLYSEDALSRLTARVDRIWYGDSSRSLAIPKRQGSHDRRRQAGSVGQGANFSGSTFSMVDAVFAPLFRYFDLINPTVTQMIFQGLPRVSLWREALALRESVVAAVGRDYSHRFKQHLVEHQAILAD